MKTLKFLFVTGLSLTLQFLTAQDKPLPDFAYVLEGGSGGETAYSIDSDKSGNIAVAGSFTVWELKCFASSLLCQSFGDLVESLV